MIMDANLRSADRTIIIECKYTESLYQSRFFADKLRSAHLYQLCAYLSNLAQDGSERDREIAMDRDRTRNVGTTPRLNRKSFSTRKVPFVVSK